MPVSSIGRCAAWLALAVCGAAVAAEKAAPAKAPPTSLVAAYTLKVSTSDEPPRSIDQKIWLKGEKFRVEMTHPQGKQITFGGPKGVYLMMSGMKGAMKLPAEMAGQGNPGRTLLGQVAKSRSQKKVGAEKVGRYAAEIYETTGPSPIPGAEPGAVATTRVWVSKEVPIPVKVVTRMPPHFESVQTLHSVTLNRSIPETMFQLPKGTPVHETPPPSKGGARNAPGGG